MRRPRKNHSAQFKAKVATAAIRGDKTLPELAEEFDLHANQIVQWKQQAMENMAVVFQKESAAPVSEAELKELPRNVSTSYPTGPCGFYD